MFFKSFTLYKLADCKLKVEELESAMRDNLFKECAPSEASSVGWVPAYGDDTAMMTRTVNGATLVALKVEERKVKSSALKAEVNKIVREEQQKRMDAGVDNARLSRAEINEIKEQVHDRMLRELPKSMSNYSTLYAYIDTQAELLVIEGSSPKKADGVAAMVRSVLPCKTFPVLTKYEMCQIMSDWLQHNLTIDADSGMVVGNSCTLRGEEDTTSKIKYTKQDLDDNHLRGHLKDEMTVSDIEIRIIDKAELTLSEEFVVRGYKLDKALRLAMAEELSGIEGEDYEIAAFDTEFQSMVMEFRDVIPLIAKQFGGWDMQSMENKSPIALED